MLIVRTPVLVEVRPLSDALSSVPIIRATPRLAVPVSVGFVALVTLAKAIPRMPRALLASPAAPNENECVSVSAPAMLSWSLLFTREKVAVASGEELGPAARS